ncbi:hypothetical protein BKA93DRAFT_794605 [Sparassis latifolia]
MKASNKTLFHFDDQDGITFGEFLAVIVASLLLCSQLMFTFHGATVVLHSRSKTREVYSIVVYVSPFSLKFIPEVFTKPVMGITAEGCAHPSAALFSQSMINVTHQKYCRGTCSAGCTDLTFIPARGPTSSLAHAISCPAQPADARTLHKHLFKGTQEVRLRK